MAEWVPSERELEILKVLWEIGSGSVREVHAQMCPQGELAFNTIQTLLRIMDDKGLVGHRGRAHVRLLSEAQSAACVVALFADRVRWCARSTGRQHVGSEGHQSRRAAPTRTTDCQGPAQSNIACRRNRNMPTENQWLLWLVFSAVAAGVFLACGAVAVRFGVQPIERLRLIQWTMLACLLAPLVNQLPGLPQWSLVWPAALPQPIEHTERVVASISNSRPVRRNEQVSARSNPESNSAGGRQIEQPIEVPPKMTESVDRSPATSAPIQIDVKPVGKPATSNPIPAIPSTERPQLPARIAFLVVAADRVDGVRRRRGDHVRLVCDRISRVVWLNRTARPVPDHVAELFSLGRFRSGRPESATGHAPPRRIAAGLWTMATDDFASGANVHRRIVFSRSPSREKAGVTGMHFVIP